VVDGISDLMEKMYNEMNQGFARLEKRIDETFKQARENNNNIIPLESKMDEKMEALFDGYRQNAEGIQRLEDKIDDFSAKVENQEKEIKVIKETK
jgi:hypothetical protein